MVPGQIVRPNELQRFVRFLRRAFAWKLVGSEEMDCEVLAFKGAKMRPSFGRRLNASFFFEFTSHCVGWRGVAGLYVAADPVEAPDDVLWATTLVNENHAVARVLREVEACDVANHARLHFSRRSNPSGVNEISLPATPSFQCAKPSDTSL